MNQNVQLKYLESDIHTVQEYDYMKIKFCKVSSAFFFKVLKYQAPVSGPTLKSAEEEVHL